MAFTTESNYTGNGSEKEFTITFPFLADGDVKVRTRPSGGSWTTHANPTHYTIAGTILTFVTAPVNNADVQIFRDTNIETANAVFQTGASIRAQDLNNLAKQFLYAAQEFEQASTTPSGTGLALTASTKNHIIVNSANDWTIAPGAIPPASLAANSVDSDNYIDGSIDTEHIGDDQVTYAKIQNVSATDRILGRDSSGAGIIEEITPANLRTMINVADGANAYTHPNHTGDVTSSADGATTIASGAVDLAHLSASGTKNNTTYLRGDNTFAVPSYVGGLFSSYAILQHTESSGTHAGTSVESWTARKINTEAADPDGIVSLSGTTQFVLGTGNYFIEARCPAYDTQDVRLRVYDVTNSTEVIHGMNGSGSTYGNNWNYMNFAIGRVVVSGSTTFELQQIVDDATADTGNGIAISLGGTELYTTIMIFKEQ